MPPKKNTSHSVVPYFFRLMLEMSIESEGITHKILVHMVDYKI